MNTLNSNSQNFNINNGQRKFKKLAQFLGIFTCYFSCLLNLSLAGLTSSDTAMWFNQNYHLKNEIGVTGEIIASSLMIVFGAMGIYIPLFLFYLGIKIYFGKLNIGTILRLILLFSGISIAMPEVGIKEQYDGLFINYGILGYYLKNFLAKCIGESGIKITSIFLLAASVLINISKNDTLALLILSLYIYTQKIARIDLVEFFANNLNSNTLFKHILVIIQNSSFFMNIINSMLENEYVKKILKIARKDSLSINLINFSVGSDFFLKFHNTANKLTTHFKRIKNDITDNLNNYDSVNNVKNNIYSSPTFIYLSEKFFFFVSEVGDEELEE